jgi:hypothetical protein
MTETTRGSGEPLLASVASWAVLAASFGLSATTWVALAELAGFTARLTVADVTLRLAWLMPVAVDGYVVVALVLWMAPVPTRVAAFAKKNTYGAAGIGIAAQSAYHLLHTMSTTSELWRVVLAAIVGALPPAVAALAVHMRALIRRESGTSTTTATPDTTPVPVPVPSPTMAPDNPPPSTIDSRPVPAPITADNAPSSVDPTTPATPEPATVPEPAAPVAVEPYPTPATVAARITTTRTTSTRPDPVPLPREAAATTRKPQPRKPATTTASSLAPSTTDTPVNESDRAQATLPVVPPDLLAKANRIARQYRTEHGTPINPGQLAVRLQVSSEEATQALAVLNLDRNPPTRPVPTVNGNRPQGGTTR